MAELPASPPARAPSTASRVVRRLFGYFLRGLVFLAPVVITLYICVAVFRAVDGWLGLPIPGSGFVVSVLLVTMFGFFASGFITRSFVLWLDDVMDRVPFVRLLYSSIRDFINAFVGEKRRFDKPVVVKLFENSSAHALGFVTQESLQAMGMADWVSVYMPHSYNFSGQMYVFPRAAVRPLKTSSSDVMAFVVSGGVTGVPLVEDEVRREGAATGATGATGARPTTTP